MFVFGFESELNLLTLGVGLRRAAREMIEFE